MLAARCIEFSRTVTMKAILQSFPVIAAFLCFNLHGATTVVVQTDKPGAHINSAMWGVFFEDINFGADGGLYAELVKNRGFEFPDSLMGWSKLAPGIAKGHLSIHDENPFNSANSHYLQIESGSNVPFGVANEGFRGMGVRKGEAYDFSAQIRKVTGAPVLRLELYSAQ